MKRIFLLSSERSGSNLVRRILNRSDEIAGPPAPQLLKAFGPYWPFIEQTPHNKKRVAELALGLCYDHPSPWDHKIEAATLLELLSKRGWAFEEVCDCCYSEYARLDGKSGYMPKENFAFDYAFQLANRFPEAKFVYLVRDPRDFALSYKKAPGGPKVAWVAAQQWKSEQQKCLMFREAHPERTFTIRYEDLVRKPEVESEKLFAFLEIPFSAEMLNPDQSSAETAAKSQYWDNLSKPIMSDNTNKFLNELSKKEIQQIESVCNPVMQHFGYVLEYEGQKSAPGRLEQLWLSGKDRLLRRVVYKRRMVDSDEFHVREKRRQIYQEIRKIAGFN